MYQFIRMVNDVGFVSTGFGFPLGLYNLFLSLPNHPTTHPQTVGGQIAQNIDIRMILKVWR